MKIKFKSCLAVLRVLASASAAPIVVRRLERTAVAAVLVFAALICPAAAAFQTVDYPSAGPGGSTVLTGVSAGRAVGAWSNAAGTAGGSFLYSNGSFTPLAHPNAVSTSAFGISGGNVVGYYTPAVGDFGTRGFVFDGSNWTDFDFPTTPPVQTYAQGIGADGTVVGL